MDQATVELLVRATARVSAAIFAAALIAFAAGHHHDRRRLQFATRLFAGFVAAHTIHFAVVGWLAVVTAGENIRERDGWPVVLTVAVLFYMAAFVVLHAWGDAARGRPSARRLRRTANVALLAIAAVFLNSYLARVERMPVYWLPLLGLAGIVAFFFLKMRQWALPR